MTPFLSTNNTSNSSASSSTPSTPSTMSAAKRELSAVPFIQQFDEIDRKLLEYRAHNQQRQAPAQMLNHAQQQALRLQQSSPQQHQQQIHQHHQHQQHQQHHYSTNSSANNQIQQQLPLRRSSSLSPQYMLPQSQAPVQMARQSSLVPTNVITPTYSIPGVNNLSTTSSISSGTSASTNPTTARGLSQSSTFDDLLSPKFNPFGGATNSASSGVGALSSLGTVNFLKSPNAITSDFSLNPGLANVNSSTGFANGGFNKAAPTVGANNNNSGSNGGASSNIWNNNNDMSVWG